MYGGGNEYEYKMMDQLNFVEMPYLVEVVYLVQILVQSFMALVQDSVGFS